MAFMKKLASFSGLGVAANILDKNKKKDKPVAQPSLITAAPQQGAGSLVTGTSTSLY
jgi:hypothetical protein